MRRTTPTFGACALGFLLLLLAASPGGAHLAVQRRSLRTLVLQADLVVFGELLDDQALVGDRGHPALARRVKVMRALKGPALPGTVLRFVRHGHGVPQYAPGEQALLFLRDLERSRELGALRNNDLRWYTNQEKDEEWSLEPRQREAVLSAVGDYAALEGASPADRSSALRAITLKLLQSRDARLSRSAVLDLRARLDSPTIESRDVPQLLQVANHSRQPIDVRIAILAELGRRGLIEGDTHWARLLRTSMGSDRLAVIPVAGAHPGPRVDEELTKILAGPDPIAASASAVALGRPGRDEAIVPLARALRAGNSRVALSAVRGLSAIATPEALEVIRDAVESHPDAAVRRRARAAIEVGTRP